MIAFGRRRGWWLIALAVLALVAALSAGGILRPYENLLADTRARLLNHEVRSDIVIVEMDAASLAALDQWPWPRN
jgi:CHASE2 domain-containing sensor protein